MVPLVVAIRFFWRVLCGAMSLGDFNRWRSPCLPPPPELPDQVLKEQKGTALTQLSRELCQFNPHA